jgi:hypothetical protein
MGATTDELDDDAAFDEPEVFDVKDMKEAEADGRSAE